MTYYLSYQPITSPTNLLPLLPTYYLSYQPITSPTNLLPLLPTYYLSYQPITSPTNLLPLLPTYYLSYQPTNKYRNGRLVYIYYVAGVYRYHLNDINTGTPLWLTKHIVLTNCLYYRSNQLSVLSF